ncbi:MAG: hypothetical protein PF689_05735 [Deltaproteobacteria bacterium]|jgi:hypothetical protein|nr:hypothetical protein [Deltaproteobacteria bacterium]
MMDSKDLKQNQLSQNASMQEIRKKVSSNVHRIAKQGNWPEYIDAKGALCDRIPSAKKKASGFDAGLACALDLIPRNRQKLISTLHAAYNEKCVLQIREEADKMLPDSETCWWLAASSLVVYKKLSVPEFQDQINDFRLLIQDAMLRRDVAIEMFETMIKSYQMINKIPLSVKNRGLQGAYLDGHDFAVQYHETEAKFFIGTFKESLGLDNFKFSQEKDENGNLISGPVFGSRQYVATNSFSELNQILKVVRNHLNG